jgi:hypothetical protein
VGLKLRVCSATKREELMLTDMVDLNCGIEPWVSQSMGAGAPRRMIMKVLRDHRIGLAWLRNWGLNAQIEQGLKVINLVLEEE